MLLTAARTIRAPLMAFFAMGVFWGAWGALVPDIKRQTGASDGELGFALLFVAVGAVPAMLAGGRLVDRFGPPLLPLSVGLFAVSVMLPAFAPSPVWLAIALFLIGFSSGLMDVVMNASVSAAEAATGVRSMQLAHGMFAVLYLAAATSTGLARSAGASPLDVLIVVAVGLGMLALLSRSSAVVAPASTEETSTGKARLFRLPERFIVLFGLIAFAAFLAENGWQSWSALFLERDFGAEPWLGSIGPATVGVSVAVGRLGGQALSARMSDATMLLIAAVLAIAGAMGFAFALSVPMALLSLFAAGAGASIIAPTMLSLAGRMATPERRGAAVAAVGVIAYTGFFVGPALLGGLSEAFGLRTALASIGGVLLLVPLLWIMHRATETPAARALSLGSETKNAQSQ